MKVLETTTGGPERGFPSTIWPDILAAGRTGHPQHRAKLDHLLRTYWKPVYAYVRKARGKTIEDAKDLTQAFFARLLSKGSFARACPQKGTFRAYLLRSIRNFLINDSRAEHRRIRCVPPPTLEAGASELERRTSDDDAETAEQAYERVWFRCLLDDSISRLKWFLERGAKGVYFEVFRAYYLDCGEGEAASPPTYTRLAARLGIQKTDVGNYLAYCRSILRHILRDRIRDTVWDEAEIGAELRKVLRG